VNWDRFLDHTDIRIILYLQDHDGARYAELLRNVGKTRGMLANSLRDMRNRKLIERIVEQTNPIQTRYRLTERGIKLAQSIINIRKAVS
jgi:DNA-binding HxlR family transcriptional regulator